MPPHGLPTAPLPPSTLKRLTVRTTFRPIRTRVHATRADEANVRSYAGCGGVRGEGEKKVRSAGLR